MIYYYYFPTWENIMIYYYYFPNLKQNNTKFETYYAMIGAMGRKIARGLY